MNTEVKSVEMSAEEMAEFQLFKQRREVEMAAAKAKSDRESYRKLCDELIESSMPQLQQVSESLKSIKAKVLEDFRCVIDMKADVLKVIRDDQRSHTFTNSTGDKRIIIGVYVTDGYHDTVEEGIAIVKEYLESLADDPKTKTLVSMVFKLLARDAKGTLKAQKVLQLRKMAEDSGNDRFMDGVRIIEEAYLPSVSKKFIRAEVKNENGAWIPVPLGMTEA